MSKKVVGLALLAVAALAAVAYGQNDRIVGCYVGTWANYRSVSREVAVVFEKL